MVFKNYFKYQLPWQVLMVLIFILSSIPGKNLPRIEFQWADKIAHFFVFGILGYFLYRGILSTQRYFLQKYSVILTILICVVYSATDEIHQIFVPGRFASLSDWIADVLGVVFFVSVYRIYAQRKKTSEILPVRTQKNGREQAGDQK